MDWTFSAGPWLSGLLVRGALLFGLIVWLAWLLGRERPEGSPGVLDGASTPAAPYAGADPELILAQRFAAGEIDSAEFLARSSVLRHAQAESSVRPG